MKVLAVRSPRQCRSDRQAVFGHRQVTDAYLTALASGNDALLATFEEGLARADPQHFVLIP